RDVLDPPLGIGGAEAGVAAADGCGHGDRLLRPHGAGRGLRPGGMKTRATKDGSDWILNGAKMWITTSPVSDVMVVWAKTDEVDEKTGEKGLVRGFVVPTDTPGVETPEVQRKLSLRASITGEIVLDNVR